MNNDNPLVPQGSLLEQKTKSRSRVKTAFFCVLAVHVLAILTALIAQGCKREQPAAYEEPPAPMPTFDTNLAPVLESMPPPTAEPLPPVAVQPPPEPTVAPAAAEYAVTRGDSFYSIGKKLGVPWKAIADANPGVDSTRLKVGQKLNIPAVTAPVGDGTTAPAMLDSGGTQTYVVKSGDNLTKIANRFGTTVKALRSANDLRTDRIRVGEKLKIPGKATAPMPEPATVMPEHTPAYPPMSPPPGAPPAQ